MKMWSTLAKTPSAVITFCVQVSIQVGKARKESLLFHVTRVYKTGRAAGDSSTILTPIAHVDSKNWRLRTGGLDVQTIR